MTKFITFFFITLAHCKVYKYMHVQMKLEKLEYGAKVRLFQ